MRCPRCSSPIGPEQDWCLECGAPARTRLAPTPNWQLPTVAISAIVLLAGALLAFAFVKLTSDDDVVPVGTTSTAVTATAPATLPPLPATTPTTTPVDPAAPATTVPGQTTPATTTPGVTTAPGATTTPRATTTPNPTTPQPLPTTPNPPPAPTP